MDSGDAQEDKDSGPDVQITFPSSVTSRIEELMGGIDQFDSAEFDPVAYINKVFPTEQSLSGVESAAARCEYHLAAVDNDIRRLVRAQAGQREAGQKALLQATVCIGELAGQVCDINKAAERSEGMVREITAEIKQLDCAKWHLTAAITALNHLHLLSRGLLALKGHAGARQYRDLVLPLQAIMEVLQHFSCYKDITELNSLRAQVMEMREQLATQILADFKDFFSNRSGGVSARTVADACAVVDVLEPPVKKELIDWFVELQLQEYLVLFSSTEECAWVGSIERRYSWLKKQLLSFEESRAQLFPAGWRMSERIAHRFCVITRSELSKLLAARRDELDVKLLLYAIQKTHNFELLLHKRFIGSEPAEGVELRAPDQPVEFNFDDKEQSTQCPAGVSPWLGLIGACFEPYLSVYIASLDNNLRQLMDRFKQDARSPTDATPTEGAATGGAVLASCADLFLFYKKCLVQCGRLTNGEPMLELAGVFQKYLREYATSVLQAALPGPPPAPSAANIVSNLHNLHTLLRDDAHTHTRYTRQEVSKVTSVITTAEYCLETSGHLQQKLKEKVSPRLSDRIDLLPEQELFHKLISSCIQLLVADLELAVEPALQAMARVPWTHVQSVGDQSTHVTMIIMHLNNTVPTLRDALSSSRKYFTQFCIRFANSFIPKFIQNIYKCKPISTVGSEQLLLDTHMLKTALLDLPSIGSDVKRPAPATYTKVVIKLMTKAEMILKMVMAPLEGNTEGFVSQFVQLLPDCTIAEFHRVLDMKGNKMSKAQLLSLDALFKEATKSRSEVNK